MKTHTLFDSTNYIRSKLQKMSLRLQKITTKPKKELLLLYFKYHKRILFEDFESFLKNFRMSNISFDINEICLGRTILLFVLEYQKEDVYNIFKTLPTDVKLIDKCFYVYQILFINLLNLYCIP